MTALLALAGPATTHLAGRPAASGDLVSAGRPLLALAGTAVALWLAVFWLTRWSAGRAAAAGAARGPVWGCGWPAPSPRMQYTASSFAQPLAAVFGRLLGVREHAEEPAGFFPAGAAYASETPDAFRLRLFRPVLAALRRAAERVRWLQQGRVQAYVLYVAVTLLALLGWNATR